LEKHCAGLTGVVCYVEMAKDWRAVVEREARIRAWIEAFVVIFGGLALVFFVHWVFGI
jgi:hypothetical protein